MRLVNRLVQQRLGFPRPRRSAEQAILRRGIVKFPLARKWLVPKCLAKFVEVANALLRQRFVGLGTLIGFSETGSACGL